MNDGQVWRFSCNCFGGARCSKCFACGEQYGAMLDVLWGSSMGHWAMCFVLCSMRFALGHSLHSLRSLTSAKAFSFGYCARMTEFIRYTFAPGVNTF